MKIKNKAQLMKIIRGDCQIAYQYYLKGQTCAVGAIALAAGVSKRALAIANSQAIDTTDANVWPPGRLKAVTAIREKIEAKFGLDSKTLATIQDYNDNNDTPAERRAAILKYLNQ